MIYAECLQEMGRFHEAIMAYRATLLLNPTQWDARNNLAGILAQTGDLDGALRELQTILHLNPNYPRLQANLNRLEHLRRKISSTPPKKG